MIDLVSVIVRGGSMRPCLPGGAEARLRPIAGDGVRAGDVVVFHRDGSWIAHRALRSGSVRHPATDGSRVQGPIKSGVTPPGSRRMTADLGHGTRDPGPLQTRGDWTGIADAPPRPADLLGTIASARIGGFWWSLESPAARAAGLLVNHVAACLRRIGAARVLAFR